MSQPKLTKRAPKQGAGLHQYVATGGKPSEYKGTKGLNGQTVPNIKSNKK